MKYVENYLTLEKKEKERLQISEKYKDNLLISML